MNITGIISEYNPLHKGHIYHIEKTKELTNADALVCVMSGNFVQRGTPSIIDKWNRTKMALLNGIDLVIELPVIYSLSSAEFFSFGAVSLLNSLGIINNICFGSEYGDINTLFYLANVLYKEPSEYKLSLKSNLDKGIAYPSARSNAMYDFISKHSSDINIKNQLLEILNSSNNILGIEYCKSLLKLGSSLKAFTVKREGGSYNSESLDFNYVSATAIRKCLKETNYDINELEKYLPNATYDLIKTLVGQSYNFTFEDLVLPYIKYKSLNMNRNIENLPDVSEGIHNKIYKELQNAATYNELISRIKSKRFTYTRISRILCQFFIGFDSLNTSLLRTLPCPYARILGFNDTGAKVLKEAKINTSIPLITKIPKNINETLALDLQATKAYSMLNSKIHPNSDYLISPIIINKNNTGTSTI